MTSDGLFIFMVGSYLVCAVILFTLCGKCLIIRRVTPITLDTVPTTYLDTAPSTPITLKLDLKTDVNTLL